MKPIKELVWRDIDMHFEAHPVTGRLKVLTNAEAISQAVKNLILTNRYERLFNPEMGGNVRASLFENLDIGDIVSLKDRISMTVRNFEPRAEVMDVWTNENLSNGVDSNNFTLSISYLPANGLAPVIIDVFLKRLR